MKNTFGNNITLTIFGESHGKAIGCVIDGIASGIEVDENEIARMLTLRRPSGAISTSRAEADRFEILSGVFNGYTTGTPICIMILNEDKHSQDYSQIGRVARPSHADYAAHIRYNGYEDYRGGGHFSGRITAALVAAGGILMPALNKKGIKIGTHIKAIADISDRAFDDIEKDITEISNSDFAVLDESVAEKMKSKILEAKNDGDSVGGILETAIVGIDAGVGEPWFDTLEGMLSHAVFSVPAVKGIEFGSGFELAKMRGSESNDEMRVIDGKVIALTNNQGGINGGISNGMPIIFRTAIKPTPTISKEQNTIDYVNLTDAVLEAKGRHDPCIVHRARIVIDSIAALVVADSLAGKYGVDWLAK